MGETHAVRAHRRRAVARGRHGEHLRHAASAGACSSVWYHFAIMFEAVFILTTLDAGTRVGRFMLQDLLGHVWRPLGRTSWYPVGAARERADRRAAGATSSTSASSIRTAASTSSGRCSASRTRCSRPSRSSVATGILVKTGKARYAWVTLVPLAWLAIVTTDGGLAEDLQRRSAHRLLRGRERPRREARGGRAAAGARPRSRRSSSSTSGSMPGSRSSSRSCCGS